MKAVQLAGVGGESNSCTQTDQLSFSSRVKARTMQELNMSCGCIALWSMEDLTLPLLK